MLNDKDKKIIENILDTFLTKKDTSFNINMFIRSDLKQIARKLDDCFLAQGINNNILN